MLLFFLITLSVVLLLIIIILLSEVRLVGDYEYSSINNEKKYSTIIQIYFLGFIKLKSFKLKKTFGDNLKKQANNNGAKEYLQEFKKLKYLIKRIELKKFDFRLTAWYARCYINCIYYRYSFGIDS